MAELFSPVDFRKYFYASLFLAVLCLIGAIIAIGTAAHGNILETSIAGTGDMDVRHDNPESADRAMMENATGSYEAKRAWGPGSDTTAFSTSFILTNAKGGYKNQYSVKGSGSAHKVVYKATQISGDFSGQGDITVTGTPSPGQNFDSLVQMDSRSGKAIFSGRVYNSKAGRPATIGELDLVGKFLLSEHLNVSTGQPENNDPLAFCYQLDKDMILSKDGALEGLYVAPVGYKLNENGKLVKE